MFSIVLLNTFDVYISVKDIDEEDTDKEDEEELEKL